MVSCGTQTAGPRRMASGKFGRSADRADEPPAPEASRVGKLGCCVVPRDVAATQYPIGT